MLTLTYL